jgi:hypothetical protein
MEHYFYFYPTSFSNHAHYLKRICFRFVTAVIETMKIVIGAFACTSSIGACLPCGLCTPLVGQLDRGTSFIGACPATFAPPCGTVSSGFPQLSKPFTRLLKIDIKKVLKLA